MESNQLITVEDLKKNIPSRKGAVTQELVDIINKSQNEPEFQGESLLQSMITYESVMIKNKSKLSDYVRALKFCAYLMTVNDNYTEAYKKTFSDREFVQKRLNADTGSAEYMDLTSAASRYRRSRLVVDILTLAQVPLDLLFTGYRYKAIGVLADVMVTARYDRDKINAAKELLAATKGPENMKIELDVGVKENSAVQQLNDQLAEFASRSMKHLESGSTDLGKLGSMKAKEDAIDAEIE